MAFFGLPLRSHSLLLPARGFGFPRFGLSCLLLQLQLASRLDARNLLPLGLGTLCRLLLRRTLRGLLAQRFLTCRLLLRCEATLGFLPSGILGGDLALLGLLAKRFLTRSLLLRCQSTIGLLLLRETMFGFLPHGFLGGDLALLGLLAQRFLTRGLLRRQATFGFLPRSLLRGDLALHRFLAQRLLTRGFPLRRQATFGFLPRSLLSRDLALRRLLAQRILTSSLPLYCQSTIRLLAGCLLRFELAQYLESRCLRRARLFSRRVARLALGPILLASDPAGWFHRARRGFGLQGRVARLRR